MLFLDMIFCLCVICLEVQICLEESLFAAQLSRCVIISGSTTEGLPELVAIKSLTPSTNIHREEEVCERKSLGFRSKC